jgi:hypothetical protein
MTINSRQELFRILKELKEENQSELQMQKKAARSLKPYKAENSDTGIEEDEEDPAGDKKSQEKPEEKPKEKNVDASKKTIEKIKKTPTTIPSKIDVSSIVDKIDLIRAGGSLKDEAIIKNLESYVFSLDEVQKKSLYVYLDSLSRIIFAKQDSAEVSVPKASNTNPQPEKQEKPSKVSNAGLPVVSVAKKS